jgi:hypothetical protein
MWNQQPSLDENISEINQLPHQIHGFEISSGFVDQNNQKWVRMEDWNRMKAAYLNLMNDHFELEDKFKEKWNEIKDGYLFLVNDNEKLEESLKQKCEELQQFKVYARKLLEERKKLNELNAVLEIKFEKKLADEKCLLEENGRLKNSVKIFEKKLAEQNSSGQKCQNLVSKSAGSIRKNGRFGIFREEKILGKPTNSHHQQPHPQMKFRPVVEQQRKNFGWNWVKPKKQNYPKRDQTFIHHPVMKEQHHRLRTIEHFEGRNGLKNFGMKVNGFIEFKNAGMKANWKKKGRFRNGIDPEVEKWFEKRMANWEKRKAMGRELNETIEMDLNMGHELNLTWKENCVNSEKFGWIFGKLKEKGLETDRSDRPMSNANVANASANCEKDSGCSERSNFGSEGSSRLGTKNEEISVEYEQFFEKFFGNEFGGRSVANLCDRPVSNANGFPRLLTMFDGAFDLFDHRYLSETS